jgi:serine/threonine protein kinase, bacterial
MVPPAIALATVVAGCSPTQPADVSASVISSQVAAVAPNSKEALEQAAHQLDVLASQAQAAEAYEFYSQRCKGIIGDLDSYKSFLAVWLEGRNPQYSGVTVKVNDSSGQVVSIDNDPNAPATSMDPRTWTFIDGRWQFDNC